VGSLESILKAGDVFGVLGREISVRLVNVSGSGCLLESASPLEPGVTATLSVALDGVTCRDEVRITRCEPLAGAAGRHAVGAQFLWTSHPGMESLRRIVRGWRGVPPVDGHRLQLVVGRSTNGRKGGKL
jgi:hypothetical protein